MTGFNILLIDDDESLRRIIEHNLIEEGYKVVSSPSGEEGLRLFKENEIDLVITDLKMPGIDGMAVLREAKRIKKDILVIMITAYGTIERAVEALKVGAFDYITKPFKRDELKIAVNKALKLKGLEEENVRLKEELEEKFKFDSLVGESSKMWDIFRILKRVSKSDSTVLLTGESGTGKELIAKAIHYNGSRRDKTFTVVNCAAIPDDLMESELFGYTKGAFTGAFDDKVGKFEYADGGTIFLDEIGDLRLELQAKLLRVLQENTIDKIGGNEPEEVDVRVIAATNRDLKKLIEKGSFREDLYYRLSVIPIRIPSLRERKDDIPLLIKHFLEKSGAEETVKFNSEALRLLENFSWPGNVRELENLVERVVILRNDNTITPQDLPDEIMTDVTSKEKVVTGVPDSGFSLEEVEKDLLLKALERNNWNQTRAAKFLNITRPTLIYRMEKYKIRRS